MSFEWFFKKVMYDCCCNSEGGFRFLGRYLANVLGEGVGWIFSLFNCSWIFSGDQSGLSLWILWIKSIVSWVIQGRQRFWDRFAWCLAASCFCQRMTVSGRKSVMISLICLSSGIRNTLISLNAGVALPLRDFDFSNCTSAWASWARKEMFSKISCWKSSFLFDLIKSEMRRIESLRRVKIMSVWLSFKNASNTSCL